MDGSYLGDCSIFYVICYRFYIFINNPYYFRGRGRTILFISDVGGFKKWLPKEKLGIGLTLVSIGGPFGVAISAPVLMYLIMNHGWRSAFIATGIIGVIWIVLWLWLSREGPEGENEVVVESSKSGNQQNEVQLPSFTKFLLSKNFVIIALCGFGTYWSFTVGLSWLPNYLENVRGLNRENTWYSRILTMDFNCMFPIIFFICIGPIIC